jgi:NitT/TauT family transport system substrate-binding protein
VTLQLKWVVQAQFAGYFAAKARGYYRKAGLDVTIKVGGSNVTPERVVAAGQAQFGIDWLPSLLAARDSGADLVNIAQVFERSGMTELTWKSSGISSIAKMRNKTVGVWCCGQQLELFAALTKYGMDPEHNRGVTLFNQPFDMNDFLAGRIDAAAAMTYNELGLVLETKNPKTGHLYTLKDLNVIKMQSVGTGTLEDGVFTTADWLSSKANRATATKFLAASFEGWIYCRTHIQSCTDIVLANSPALARRHQLWQMNEVNALIWPSTLGIGVMRPAAFSRTAGIARQFGVIKKAPSGTPYRTDLAKAALRLVRLDGMDPVGKGFRKQKVKLTPGGA